MQCISCNEHEANKDSGLCNQCESQEENKINGLLYLPAAGLAINMLMSPYAAWTYFSAIIGFLQQGMGITGYGIGGVVMMIIELLLTFFTGWCFFKRKKGIRKVIIPYYLFGLAYVFYFLLLQTWLFDTRLDTADIRNLLTPLVAALIWIPYFLKSKRINRVFCQ
jgi:hypothetical protein